MWGLQIAPDCCKIYKSDFQTLIRIITIKTAHRSVNTQLGSGEAVHRIGVHQPRDGTQGCVGVEAWGLIRGGCCVGVDAWGLSRRAKNIVIRL